MIKHNLRIFSQNVRKNKILTDTILETHKSTSDIILIQEPPRFLIRRVPSCTNSLGDSIFRTPNYPEWSLFIRSNLSQDNYPQVAMYINKCLSKLQFALCLDIVNYCDINLIAFHNEQDTSFIINMYSDSNQTALYIMTWQNG